MGRSVTLSVLHFSRLPMEGCPTGPIVSLGYPLGAVLSQDQGSGRRVIAYASRSLRQNEKNMRNYSSFKLELLGLKWAVTEKFRGYLLGSKCEVMTDNNPLSHLQTAKLGAIEQRWAAELALFDLNIRPERSWYLTPILY